MLIDSITLVEEESQEIKIILYYKNGRFDEKFAKKLRLKKRRLDEIPYFKFRCLATIGQLQLQSLKNSWKGECEIHSSEQLTSLFREVLQEGQRSEMHVTGISLSGRIG